MQKQSFNRKVGRGKDRKLKAPGLILDRKIGLVDEVEVYRIFGGCLPAESTAANSFFKTFWQLNGQREGDAKIKSVRVINTDHKPIKKR